LGITGVTGIIYPLTKYLLKTDEARAALPQPARDKTAAGFPGIYLPASLQLPYCSCGITAAVWLPDVLLERGTNQG
jgi:hypothetical protein